MSSVQFSSVQGGIIAFPEYCQVFYNEFSSVQFTVVLLHSLNTAKCFYNEFSSVQFTVVLLHSLNTAKCFTTSSVQFTVVLLHSETLKSE